MNPAKVETLTPSFCCSGALCGRAWSMDQRLNRSAVPIACVCLADYSASRHPLYGAITHACKAGEIWRRVLTVLCFSAAMPALFCYIGESNWLAKIHPDTQVTNQMSTHLGYGHWEKRTLLSMNVLSRCFKGCLIMHRRERRWEWDFWLLNRVHVGQLSTP